MLPQELATLFGTLVGALEAQRPIAREMAKLGPAAMLSLRASGQGGWSSGMTYKVREQIIAFIDERADEIWESMHEAVEAIAPDPYPELSADLKAYLNQVVNPVIRTGENEIRILVQKVNFSRSTWDIESHCRTLTRKGAEIDLFCAKYAMNHKKKSEPPAQTITNTFHAPNSRVNINSQDFSTNVVNSENIFSEMRKALEQIPDVDVRAELLREANELEENVGKSGFLKAYQTFIGLAANHMEIIGPWMPALAKLLTG